MAPEAVTGARREHLLTVCFLESKKPASKVSAFFDVICANELKNSNLMGIQGVITEKRRFFDLLAFLKGRKRNFRYYTCNAIL